MRMSTPTTLTILCWITENFSLENSYFSYWLKTLAATKMFFHHYKNKLIFHSSDSEPCRVIPIQSISLIAWQCKLHPCCPRSQPFLPSCRISHSVCVKIKTEKKEEKPIYKHHSNQYLKEGFPFSSLNIINIYLLCQWLKFIFSILNSLGRITGRKYH